MSIQNIEVPNDLTLYCGTLNANTINFNNASVDTLDVDNINEKTLNHGVILQGNINVSNAGVITFPQVGTEGIKLPTVGGTQALLNSYETLSIPTTMAGIFSPPVDTTLNLVRIGSIVSLTILAASSSGVPGGNATITFADNLPARFSPSDTTAFSIILLENMAYVAGQLFITSAGVVTAQLLSGDNFMIDDAAGFGNNTTVTYNTL